MIVSLVWSLTNAPAVANQYDPPGAFQVCFDFSCKSHEPVKLTKADWQRVVQLFSPASTTPADERQRLRQAIAVMETIVGNHTPTYRDIGGNSPLESNTLAMLPGQMDCIDESLNATTYLTLLQGEGLMKFHLVRDRVYRKSWLNQHWAAQIVDSGSGQHYVIDSWFEDNGEPPALVKSENWHDLSIF